MDASELADLLRATKERAKADIASKQPDGRARWAHIDASTVQAFGEALATSVPINLLNEKIYVLPNESGTLNLRTAAVYLVDRAIDFDASEIIDDLIRISETKIVKVLYVRAIAGITVSEVVDLGGGFSIVPPAALPPADNVKDVFSGDPYHPVWGYGPAPTAAAIFAQTIQLPLFEPGSRTDLPMWNDHADFEQGMRNALRAATLATRGLPVFRQGFTIVDSLGWPGMLSNGVGEARAGARFHGDQCADPALLVQASKRLSTAKPQLNLAVEKLESSRRRMDWVEAAVDLGTCLEILLMHGSDDNNEISYKLATRAAWLLGGTAEDRIRVFDLTRELYNSRSKAVHTGTIIAGKRAKTGENPATKFAEYDSLCVALINRLADLSAWPNWRNLVLGAGV